MSLDRLNCILRDGRTACWCVLYPGVMRTELAVEMERVLYRWNTLVCVDDKNSSLYSQIMIVVLWHWDADLYKSGKLIFFK